MYMQVYARSFKNWLLYPVEQNLKCIVQDKLHLNFLAKSRLQMWHYKHQIDYQNPFTKLYYDSQILISVQFFDRIYKYVRRESRQKNVKGDLGN